MTIPSSRSDRERLIRALFDDYIEMYAGRDDRLIHHFSDNFSGYTGGGDFFVKDRVVWEEITRQDFAQVPARIRFELLDLSLQDISDDVVLVTALFHIHLPIPDPAFAKEVARLVLLFRLEGSIGVTLFLGTDANPNDVLTAADAAMYRAKDAGRNSVWSAVAVDQSDVSQ